MSRYVRRPKRPFTGRVNRAFGARPLLEPCVQMVSGSSHYKQVISGSRLSPQVEQVWVQQSAKMEMNPWSRKRG